MPIYEFECKNCGHVLEEIMKINDPAPQKCPACEHGPMVKLMSRTHFVLKGQGWYETDFKDKPGKKGETGDAKNSSSAAKADEKKDSDSAGKTKVGLESKPTEKKANP